MDPIALQKKLKSNNEDLMQFCKELKSWREEMDGKSEKSNEKKPSGNGRKPSEKRRKVASRNKSGLIDYSVWDKINVDAEESDNSEASNLTDEHDETARDEAYLQKEKGNKFVKEQKWDEAIVCYTKAIELYLYDPIFYANRALCHLKKQNYEKAEADATKSLALDQKYVKAYQRRAAAREALGKLEEAESDLTLVLEIEPRNKESLDKILSLKEKLKDKKQQRPISKFTLSRNKGNSKSKTINNNSTERMNFKDDDIIPVRAITKPAHLKSNQPLRSIPIIEVSEPVNPLTRTTLNTDDLKVIEKIN